MTFIEALKTGRPMRRTSGADWYRSAYVYLGNDGRQSFPNPVWRDIQLGKERALSREDYLAADWEVMP